MGKRDLLTRTYSLVDDVVSQGVCYCFELSVLEDGRHSAALIRPVENGSPVFGGIYESMDAMSEWAPVDLLRQGVPPSVVSYVVESLNLFSAYR